MKKAALILLICIYSLATMGFCIHQFYCCGKLKYVSVTIAQDAEQKVEKGNEKNGCCQNRYHFFKVKDKHVAAGEISGSFINITGIHSFTHFFGHIIFTASKIIIENRSNAPPPQPGIPIYVYNCIFRI